MIDFNKRVFVISGVGLFSEDKEKDTSKRCCDGSVNAEAVKSLVGILNESGLYEIEYSNSDIRIKLTAYCGQGVHLAPHGVHGGGCIDGSRGDAQQRGACDEVSADKSSGNVIASPMVGTAYLSPKPGTPAFVHVGSDVVEGQTLLIIEAMKVLTPLKSPVSGKIAEIHVKNGAPVEYGEPLMTIS
ncbi:acetyl-CoA carboxylase biotin carboxyl carrier protein [Candidatus Hydrogenosomobacter endosymbioticus]|uniref:Biotin carboxyl carrier protein of acetyl-CoA carboxylase n=1 Tax=Candidatus Hydrogenosomobacter endosymbioticus TaxID=2558174 RepID=A0ABM7V901_9PROT|nr:biotin/lipoyl-containing protein [Candidatus Hydrogenosomobacter endosymbioticus]BDB96271.1 acetyl-CoA carboxylase biotin carboxyl carrier protein subunit [Candidatus Hydrogenosomobacter endosymbioticus]